ncbi:ROK family transcriptional regulator [Shouchella shacheensis]|uniref:ROK family transcriptional regulator n=1 Tax=Shouchella shacheensis TaxID=1649580 RepID=UPI000740118B|nr:ROK family transcriptional regulator [Shouchella shacheensis]
MHDLTLEKKVHLIQAMNRSNILNLIRLEGPISKRAVAKRIQVSPTTVNSIVSDLMREGFVKEKGVGYSTGGRKPVLYTFDPDVNFVIAVSLSNSSIRIASLNLNGDIKEIKTHATEKRQGRAYIELFLNALTLFVEHLEDLSRCVGISIIAPGVVDAKRGVIKYNARLALFEVGIKKLVEETFGITTFLDNDTHSFVIAERYFGADAYRNLLYITVGEGVGSGILVNGEIYRGHSGSSGEIGHMAVVQGGAPCSCGNKGCLENYVSWPTIHSKIVSALLTQGVETSISAHIDGDFNSITPELFVEAVEEGDPLSMQLIEEMAEYLSVAIVNAVHLLNPEAVVLSGELVQGNETLLALVREKVSRRALPSVGANVGIHMTSLRGDIEMLGALSVLLQEEMHVGRYSRL